VQIIYRIVSYLIVLYRSSAWQWMLAWSACQRDFIQGCISPVLSQTTKAPSGDLLGFYNAIIRAVMEYASPVRHSSLTAAQTESLESLQKWVVQIITPHLDYSLQWISGHHRSQYTGGLPRATRATIFPA